MRFTAFVCLIAFSLASHLAAEIAETTSGPVRAIAGDGLLSFLGVPFAAPPMGELRWSPPKEPEAWEAPLDANTYSPECGHVPGFTSRGDEDCLYLNIWTNSLTGARPVMLWIHGGGFRGGSSQMPEAFTQAMVREDIVLVSIQYRLGVMGFFAHEAIDSDVANFGLLDMVQALKWVRRNIANFGGDPEQVTIFGVSAGGMAVQMLMTSPLSAGLFSGAIAQSGYGTWPLPSVSEAKARGAELGLRAGLPKDASLDRLKSLSAEEWEGTYREFHLPIVDGVSLPLEPAQAFHEGVQHQVPTILGGTSFEGTTISGAGFDPETYLDTWGDQATRARELYASDLAQGEAIAATRLFGDVRYVIGSRLIARLHSELAPSYLYYFGHVPPVMREDWVGAPHGFLTMVLFGVSGEATEGQVAAETSQLGELLRAYWVNFARTGDPNNGHLPSWPHYQSEKDNWLVIRDEVSVESQVIKDKLDFIEADYWRRIERLGVRAAYE